MATVKKIQENVSRGMASLTSLVKVALQSRQVEPIGRCGGSVIVMGNGPSLRDAIDNHRAALERHDLVSVNFAPVTPEFFELRPEMHVIADPAFFDENQNDNFKRMWEALHRVDWAMTLFVPVAQRRSRLVSGLPGNIKIKCFNMTAAEGWNWLERRLYTSGLAMPRPRNVLIPAIMCAIRQGYDRIGVVGADHSWSRTLWVDDDNCVVTVQPHFYKDNKAEEARVKSVYQNIHLHQIYESFSIAFKSYFKVLDYAKWRGVEIVNLTPGSFIDAFDRGQLSEF